MASLSRARKSSRGGKPSRIIQFHDAEGKRRTIRLPGTTQRDAKSIKSHVQHLVAAQISGEAYPPETAKWLRDIDNKLRERLANVGLIRRVSVRLDEFIEQFIQSRVGVVEERTITIDRQAQRSMLEFFGAECSIRDITEGDAADFRNWLLTAGRGKKGGYAEETVRKRCSVAGKVMRHAIRHRLIDRNPFEEVPTSSGASERSEYVAAAKAVAVVEQLPTSQWRLLFALSRWGGLRVGSEVRKLRWGDVDWEKRQFLVHSTKQARHKHKATRYVPLWPGLLELFEERFAEAEEGEEYVLPFLIDRTDASLRDPLKRAIKRAGFTPWDRLWHSMRVSRQTELERTNPTHVVCYIMNNDEKTARKHYLKVEEEDFANIAADASCSAALQQNAFLPEMARKVPQTPISENGRKPLNLQGVTADCGDLRDSAKTAEIVREGFEHPQKPRENRPILEKRCKKRCTEGVSDALNDLRDAAEVCEKPAFACSLIDALEEVLQPAATPSPQVDQG